MPAYLVELEHRESDQVFSYYHGNKLMHFNASLLARLHKSMPGEFRRITLDITQGEYDLCMQHRGVEEPKVAGLPARQLREPGYGVMFEDGSFTIIDGHHRLVRRFRGGVRVMDFWVTDETIWRHCLVEYTEEGEREISASLPPKVDLPERLLSTVELHPKSKN
jgi:hypothetical protein